MFFRTPRFLRRWVRRKMHPMAEEAAWTMKERLSVIYMLLAWNGAGFVIYQLYKGNVHWPVTQGLTTAEEENLSRPSLAFAETLNIPKAKAYRLSSRGFVELPEINLLEKPASDQNQGTPTD